MANPVWSWLKGDHLPRRQVAQPQQRVEERKLYYYPDQITPSFATQPDINSAIRMGTLVHGPGASELIYKAWHHEDSNSAVYACLRFICTAAIEAPLTVFQQTDIDDREARFEHPMQELIERPNPNFGMKTLEYYKQWCKLVNGNAYWRKVRSGQRNIVELWPISPLRIVPVTTKEDAQRGVFISYYAYKFDPAKDPERIPPEDIVHFRLGLNDKDHRMGDSPLARVSREVMGDEESLRWQSMLLGNGGAASMVVEVPSDSSMTEDDAEMLKTKLTERFSGINRGAVGVLMGGAKITQYGFSPEQMNMRELHKFPEERISAVFGAPAVIVGLGAGLEHSIYNNYHEAREAFTEDTLLPLYKFDADTLNIQLKPEFTADPNILVDYDINRMRALQEDTTNKYKRVTEAWKEGLLTLNQSLTELGFPAEPEGDVRKPEMTAALAPAPPALAPGGPPKPGLPPGQDEDEDEDAEKQMSQKQRRSLNIGDLESMPEILQALVELAEPAMQRDLERHLDRQRRTVKRRLIAGG